MSDRVILHSDCNAFYASCEEVYHPELEGKPVAVGGDPEARHGIILTANYLAKKVGVKTGMALWQAKQQCPGLVILHPHMDRYLRFSKLAHDIYADYTDLIEPFGLDESWLDVTACLSCIGSGMDIARDISRRIKRELGITVSIGVSWNKIFAKFGSDYKKPDAITEINRDNYKSIVWESPAGDLLNVGRATKRKLANRGITKIGGIAEAEPEMLYKLLGKMGLVLRAFARGEDMTPVCPDGTKAPIKSIGNSTTTPRDLENDEDVKMVAYLLSESVAARLRENALMGSLIGISVRDVDLMTVNRQKRTDIPTNISKEIAETAMQIFRETYTWQRPIRSLGVRVADLVPDSSAWQPDLFTDPVRREKQLKLDIAVNDLRRRFGHEVLQRGMMYFDRRTTALDAKSEEHMVHPHSYMEYGNRTGAYGGTGKDDG